MPRKEPQGDWSECRPKTVPGSDPLLIVFSSSEHPPFSILPIQSFMSLKPGRNLTGQGARPTVSKFPPVVFAVPWGLLFRAHLTP